MNLRDTCQRISIEGHDLLEDLALNLRSSWNHSTDQIWRQLEPELWELTNNPWAILQTVSTEKLTKMLSDPTFSELVKRVAKERKDALDAPTWFGDNHAQSALRSVAYFSMEFMLSETLPIYSGGLGNVAGDQLKAASDLGVPVVAVGLLYARGYFRQFIDKNGEQQELYPYNDPGQLPIRPLRLPNGEWLRIKIDFPGWCLWLRTWEAKVGRRTLYLLDSNDPANFPAHRGITSELYGGDSELRLKQELILGIGGWRLLRALSIDPEVCHMNEGHAAFVVLERAFDFMQKTKTSFDAALTATRIGNLFTTHTAVSSGFDRFSPDLICKYLGKYAENHLKISFEKLLSLGQLYSSDDFNMAYLAIRGSGFVNGVSQLHGCVSRHLFKDLFPRFPEKEIPIGSVTNGIHVPTWDSPPADQLWTEYCGQGRWLGNTEELEQKVKQIPDEKVWEMRNASRAHLIEYARTRLTRQLEARGASQEEIEKAKTCLNPNALTLGFARRFASYKRPDLLLEDEARLVRILTDEKRPVQLLVAGKAHPADKEGHALIQRWMRFIKQPEVRWSVIFLSDYDMILTEHLVQGVDLWINTPRRPWEASGTSGMKILVNGGLNLSELDGWWAEAYCPEVGWALGDRNEHGDDPEWDRQEAGVLYDLLEKEVIPQFYSYNGNGMPHTWIGKIRESMARLTPRFSSNRALREYTENFYLPAAARYRKRAENKGALAQKMVEWRDGIERNWDQLKFGEMRQENSRLKVEVYLSGLSLDAIKVELYAEHEVREMRHEGAMANTQNGHIYAVDIQGMDSLVAFTPRIVPYFPEVEVPLELGKVLWQR